MTVNAWLQQRWTTSRRGNRKKGDRMARYQLRMEPLEDRLLPSTFNAPIVLTAGASPHAEAIGDFNGDGKPDLAVVNFNSASVSVFLGNGDGTFAPQITFATGAQPSSVAVG